MSSPIVKFPCEVREVFTDSGYRLGWLLLFILSKERADLHPASSAFTFKYKSHILSVAESHIEYIMNLTHSFNRGDVIKAILW